MKEKIERAARKEANGTHLLGEISGVSFDRIRKNLGEPEDGDGYKVDAEWTLRIQTTGGARIATLYNWKNGPSYGGDEVDTITDWHVGAHDLSASDAREIMAALWMLLGGDYYISRRV